VPGSYLLPSGGEVEGIHLHRSGWYWSAAGARLMAYESRLEIDAMMLSCEDLEATSLPSR
jgi:hypothetical protein